MPFPQDIFLSVLPTVKKINKGMLKKIFKVYLSKNWFKLGGAKPEVVMSSPPIGDGEGFYREKVEAM